MRKLELGQAEGSRYWDDQKGGTWRWFAYTTAGTECGEGTSPENCQTQIEAALQRLHNGSA